MEASQSIRWFTDGERRNAKQQSQTAIKYLKSDEYSRAYGHRKGWREGLEVAMKVKGSQGHPRVEWVLPEHPYTAISPKTEIHANHNEAHNSALRRRCSAYRRRQNLYAKKVEGLQRSLTVQRLVHNWVRPHWALGKKTTLLVGSEVVPSTGKDGGTANLARFFIHHVLADQCQRVYSFCITAWMLESIKISPCTSPF